MAAERPAVITIVKTHERKILPIIFQFISFQLLSHKLIPITAPVIHCVDEIGMPYRDANETTRPVASSAEKPREGEMYVIFFPRTSIILIP
jgi:hypothetical protein